MKKTVLLLLIVSTLLSCSKDCDNCGNDGNIQSRWILTEQLVDPGDGSGEFNPVDSDKVIEFLDNARIISNGSLCDMTITSDAYSSGRIIMPDNVIIPDDCDGTEFQYHFVVESDTLIIYYPCIEGCAHKYLRLSE